MLSKEKIQLLEYIITQYPYRIKGDTKKACEQILQLYPSFEIYHSPDPQNKGCWLIEMTGEIIKKKYEESLIVSIFFAYSFPTEGPKCYFINPNPSKFVANTIYEKRRYINSNNKIYYSILIEETSKWHLGHDISKLLRGLAIEANKGFPFIKKEGGCLADLPKTMQPEKNPFITYINQQNEVTLPSNPQQKAQSENILTSNLANSYMDQARKIASKLQTDLNGLRKNMVDIQKTYLDINSVYNDLLICERDMIKSKSDFEQKIQFLDDIVKTNENACENIDHKLVIKGFREEADILIDLMSTNSALEDVNVLLETALKANTIDLETFLKSLKDNSEKQFTNRILIQKISQYMLYNP